MGMATGTDVSCRGCAAAGTDVSCGGARRGRSEQAVAVRQLGRGGGNGIPVLNDLAVLDTEQVVVRHRDPEGSLGLQQDELALGDDLVDLRVGQRLALL